MGDRDLFTGGGDQAVTKTTGTGQPPRDLFAGGGDSVTSGQTGAALPGDLHSVWGKGNCNWKPDKDNTHPAVQAWQAASREHWHDPIKLDCNGYYVAKNPDCLDSIASRVVETTSGKPATGDQIRAEKAAIIQANLEHYPDIACNPHFIRDGWVLQLPGMKAPDNCAAPEAPPAKPVAPEPPPAAPEPPPAAPEPPPAAPERPARRTERGTGITIDNESGGTVIINEGNGVDCACGPPPRPLAGQGRQQEQYSELPPPPQPLFEQPPQVWGRSLVPGLNTFTAGPEFFIESQRRFHHPPPGYAYGPPPGWNGQPQGWNGQPQGWNGQPQGWNGQPQNFGQTQGFGQPQTQMSYWQYQQYLRHQHQMQRRGYQPTVAITANIGNGSDWVD